MGPLNFATVMKVLKGNIPEENFVSQPHFVHLLFADAINADWGSENSGAAKVLDFDQAQVSRWFTGQAKLSPNIINFYKSGANGEKLCKQIEDKILPLMPDSAMAVEELYNLVLQAGNVSSEKKMELADRDAFENENDKALFITEVLCLAMQLPYKYWDIREPQLLTSGNPSPVVVDYIFDTDVPRPCRWFLGREKELEQLHELLLDHDKVFLHGIPGIGKSELAKAYAKKHRKEYTNIIYINYPGDLRQAVINLDFADDLPNECEEDRLKKHNRFLRSLREDTLLIVDNFNVTASQDSFLDTMLKYRCRIIFTTRCRYENYITQEVFELNPDILLELVGKFYPHEEQDQGGINRIVELLHRHTFAVELAARLLAKGRMDLEELLDKLEREKTALDAEDKIGTVKDGRNRKATYYDQIHSLFSFYELSDAEQEILRCMTLVPANGISSRQFAEWMAQPNMNTINDLMEMGFIHPKNDWEILLHPMIREIAVEELKPSVRNAAVLLDELQRISLMHGLEFMNNKSVFHTIENIITTIHKDEISKYLLLLEDAFQYMEKYRYKSGMQAVVNELTAMLSDNSVGTSADRACLLDARAVLEKTLKSKLH